jgi:cell division septum initiation protein DivIVA
VTIYDDDEPEEPDEPAPSPYAAPETEQLLNRIAEIIENARPMPLSASSMIIKEEVLELLDDAIDRLPDELRAARWLLKERDEFLAKVRREGDEILDQARTRAERMVQRTEVVKAAEQRARQIIDAAEVEARRMRHEVEDFCDQKLAGFEIVLERTMKMVAAGREKLQGNPLSGVGIDEADDLELGNEFFDQGEPAP